MIDYEVRLERCKREDTKELMIQCMDKAAFDNNKEQTDTFIFCLELAGLLLIATVLLSLLLRRCLND